MSEQSPITIRHAIPEDAHQLATLVRNGMPGYPFLDVYDPEAVTRAIIGGETRIVAVHELYGVVATAVLGTDHMSEIKRVVVGKAARGNGYAKEMTLLLAQTAYGLHKVPWADARAIQIPMQRAALTAGLLPISLESGKHVVYHPDVGPARETMVHMTSLKLPHAELLSSLSNWPGHLRHQLAANMLLALNPTPKSPDVVALHLKSSVQTKTRIAHQLTKTSGISCQSLGPDITQVVNPDGQFLVILPDASGFITGLNNADGLANLAQKTGLQILTCYQSVTDLATSHHLHSAGFIPTMVRPWQDRPDTNPKWQVGWRKTSNGYDHCLHPVNLDPAVKQIIQDLALTIHRV